MIKEFSVCRIVSADGVPINYSEKWIYNLVTCRGYYDSKISANNNGKVFKAKGYLFSFLKKTIKYIKESDNESYDRSYFIFDKEVSKEDVIDFFLNCMVQELVPGKITNDIIFNINKIT